MRMALRCSGVEFGAATPQGGLPSLNPRVRAPP